MDFRDIDVETINNGDLDPYIKNYGIENVQELIIVRDVLSSLGKSTVGLDRAITRVNLLVDKKDREFFLSKLTEHITKLTTVKKLPIDFSSIVFKRLPLAFKNVFELKQYEGNIKGVGEVKQKYLSNGIRMFDDRIEYLIQVTPFEELGTNLFNKDIKTKRAIVDSYEDQILNNLFEIGDNFSFGKLTDKDKYQALNNQNDMIRKMICEYVAYYNDVDDLKDYPNNEEKVLRKFMM